MTIFVLWLITSSYATQLGIYPNGPLCALMGAQLNHGLQEKPRSVLGTVVCVETLSPGALSTAIKPKSRDYGS